MFVGNFTDTYRPRVANSYSPADPFRRSSTGRTPQCHVDSSTFEQCKGQKQLSFEWTNDCSAKWTANGQRRK